MKYLLLLLFGVSLQAELDLTLPEQPAVYIPPEPKLLNLGDYNEPPTKTQLITYWTLNVLDVYTTYEGMKRCSTCTESNPFLPDKPKLEELDIQYMRAQEAGEDTSEIVATKNKLRDFPAKPEIDSATTVEELKAIWDNDLGDK